MAKKQFCWSTYHNFNNSNLLIALKIQNPISFDYINNSTLKYFNCSACPCALERTKPSICDTETGACHCSERFQGENCASCAKRFQNFPVCHRPGMFIITRNQCYCSLIHCDHELLIVILQVFFLLLVINGYGWLFFMVKN